MGDWTKLLPEGVQSPIIVEIRTPGSWQSAKNKSLLSTANKEIASLKDDRDWLDSKAALLGQTGADHFAALLIATGEHWRATVGEPGQPNRREGPPGGELLIRVHLPPAVATTAADAERATQTVMDWFESSKLGQIYLRLGRTVGMKEVSARGVRYDRVADLAYISKDAEEEVQRV